MITVENTLTGGQIGRALMGDAEETAFCLVEMADERDTRFIREVAAHIEGNVEVVAFLREMADAIENGETV